MSRLTLWWVTANQLFKATSTPSKKLDVQEGKKDKVFADHVTQVCEAHD